VFNFLIRLKNRGARSRHGKILEESRLKDRSFG
jgi:hypothetical protein